MLKQPPRYPPGTKFPLRPQSGLPLLHRDSHSPTDGKETTKPENRKISTGPTTAAVLSNTIDMETDIEAVALVSSDAIPRKVRHSGRFWQALIDVAAELPEGEALRLRLSQYGSYERVRSGLYKAAKKMGLGVTLTHDDRVVYVERVIHVEKVVHSAR